MKTKDERLIDALQTAARDAEALLKSTTRDLSEQTCEARVHLRATIDNAKAACQRLEVKARVGANAADWAYRKHPYQTIGIGLVVGLLVGALVGRKQDWKA